MLNSFFYLVKQGFKNLWNNRLMSLASIGVLVSCMLLIGAAALLAVNVSSVVDELEDQSEAIVYLDDNTTDEEQERIRKSIISTGKIATIEFIPKEEALSSMMDSMGDEGLLFEAYKEDNNLPDSYRVTFDDVSDLELLSEGETRPFMMTAFGANNNHVTDLSYEAIVEGDDGVYQIAENLDTDGVPIDNDFQNLVNSVLK